MSKYRKKPVIIDAIQWTGHNWDDVCDFVPVPEIAQGVEFSPPDEMHIRINTLEGEMTAKIGDFIIRGIKGEFYPCRADIFEATYEAVEESAEPAPPTVRELTRAERIATTAEIIPLSRPPFNAMEIPAMAEIVRHALAYAAARGYAPDPEPKCSAQDPSNEVGDCERRKGHEPPHARLRFGEPGHGAYAWNDDGSAPFSDLGDAS